MTAGDYALEMILLPLNVKSDYPGRSGPCRGEGGGEEGQSWRERLRWEGGVEAAFVLSRWLFHTAAGCRTGLLAGRIPGGRWPQDNPGGVHGMHYLRSQP